MFDVAAESYGRFMGRYSVPLAALFADTVDLGPGRQVLDVGCGPGALTAELVTRVGAAGVTAIDPSPPFVAAVRQRFPDLDVREGTAEGLPYADDTFDAALAALVVLFMDDPVAGLRQMGRVTRPGGTVAACVWDHGGGAGPLSFFWSVVAELDPGARDESGLAGAREGHLAELVAAAGLGEVVSDYLTVTVGYAGFEDWWEPYTLGVGPAGAYVQGLGTARRDALREACRARLGDEPFEVRASAWSVTALSPAR